LNSHKQRFNEMPKEWEELNLACITMTHQIKDIMPKLPFCKDYFQMLYIINFFSCYFNTLKQMHKMPILDKAEKIETHSCPALFPPLPLRQIVDETKKISLSDILKEFPENKKENLFKYLQEQDKRINQDIQKIKKDIENKEEIEDFLDKENTIEPLPYDINNALKKSYKKLFPKGKIQEDDEISDFIIHKFIRIFLSELAFNKIKKESFIKDIEHQAMEQAKKEKLDTLKIGIEELLNQLRKGNRDIDEFLTYIIPILEKSEWIKETDIDERYIKKQMNEINYNIFRETKPIITEFSSYIILKINEAVNKEILNRKNKLEEISNIKSLKSIKIITDWISFNIPYKLIVTKLLTPEEIRKIKENSGFEIKGGCGLSLENRLPTISPLEAKSLYSEIAPQIRQKTAEEWISSTKNGNNYSIFRMEITDYHAITSWIIFTY
jgi:hypothetical protein